MKKLTLAIVSAAVLFGSCGKQRPTINHEVVDTMAIVDDRTKDTTKILVSELPVKFDSTDVMLFAIGLVDLQERGGYSKIVAGSYSSSEIASSYFNRDNLIGNFINIVFQDKNGNDKKLTDKMVKIRSVDFLRDIFKRTKTAYLLYSISDRDSNGDKELDHADLEALYISKIDGSGFRKLTKERHEFYDWSILSGESKIYFRTLADKNRDGELTNEDKFHYYFIDFSGDNYSVTEYNPVKVFE